MKLTHARLPWSVIRWGVVLAAAAAGAMTYSQWWPRLNGWVQSTAGGFRPAAAPEGHGGESHAGHGGEGEAGHADHAAHAGHSAENSIDVSPQALRNLGLTPQYLRPVTLSTYRKSIRVPAVIVEQPGRTRIAVATPMTAIVTQVHVLSGQAVLPGQLLFSLRLTHEDLVNSQTEFLKTLGEVDVERQELERLRKVTSGALPPSLILERQYAVQKLEARLSADREALKLHGLSDQQVQGIESGRKLLSTLEVYAPRLGEQADSEFRLTKARVQPVLLQVVSGAPASDTSPDAEAGEAARGPTLVLEELRIHQGQSLTAGETLCVLADYSRLYLEGQAFEQDSPAIMASRERGWPLTAHFEGDSADSRIDGLQIAYVANQVETATRTLHFYVDLPNIRLPQSPGANAERFVTWKYRPGQRLELAVPVEEWTDQLVLPVNAVAQEGAEAFVFLQNGKHFDRKPVHVKYRDQTSVVVANDGSIFPGDIVALRGAHQLQMALKNKSGGGVDPHAGHTH